MPHIAVYAEDLGGLTSSTPSREMLRHLLHFRSQDLFTLVFCKDSEANEHLQDYLTTLSHLPNWQTYELPFSRRAYNALSLLGARFLPAIPVEADLYLRFDAGAMGRRNRPLINLVADLSALRQPRAASLKWHGRLLFRRALRDGAEIASRTVCISAFTASDVAEAFPQLASRLTVIRNGIADDWFEEVTTMEENSPPRPYFIWYGFVSARKNLPRLIAGYAAAADAFGPEFPDLMLIASGPDIRSEVLQPIETSGIASRAHIVDPQPLKKLISLVSQARGLVFPSLYEGFGMPVVEAFARGLPVLTSRFSATAEIGSDLAEYCDPQSVSSIRDGLIRLASPKQLEPERVAARKAYARQFTAGSAARAYSTLIDEVLSRPSAA